jgi:ABC-type lipoprotein release transport system permease subunit
LTLIFKEIFHRKGNFLFSGLAVFVAVVLFVAFVATGDAYRRETRRIMRNMGQNLRIIPKETGIDEFWTYGFSELTMPEAYVHRFSEIKGFSYTHLTATLQQKATWRDMNIILTGILPEVLPLDKRMQSQMMFSVDQNTIYIGYEVAQRFKISRGDTIDLFGKRFHVANCLSNTGSLDDIRIYGHLHDIQKSLNLPGRINEIKALECLCLIESGEAKTADAFSLAKQQLEQILPEAQVILLQGIANIRQTQRAAMEGYISLILLLIVIACSVWVGILSMMNVRDREHEIGVLRVLGHGSIKIACLFLGRSFAVGILGVIPGCFIGTLLALMIGPDIFKITADAIQPDYIFLAIIMIVAPVLSVVSGFIPTMIAISQDPSITLGNE